MPAPAAKKTHDTGKSGFFGDPLCRKALFNSIESSDGGFLARLDQILIDFSQFFEFARDGIPAPADEGRGLLLVTSGER